MRTPDRDTEPGCFLAFVATFGALGLASLYASFRMACGMLDQRHPGDWLLLFTASTFGTALLTGTVAAFLPKDARSRRIAVYIVLGGLCFLMGIVSICSIAW